MSRRGNSSTAPCEICGEWKGQTGFAYVSHMRKHVRNGEATEHLSGDWQFGGRYEYKSTGKFEKAAKVRK